MLKTTSTLSGVEGLRERKWAMGKPSAAGEELKAEKLERFMPGLGRICSPVKRVRLAKGLAACALGSCDFMPSGANIGARAAKGLR